MDTFEGQIYLWLLFVGVYVKGAKKNMKERGSFFVGVYVKCVSMLSRLKNLTVMHRRHN